MDNGLVLMEKSKINVVSYGEEVADMHFLSRKLEQLMWIGQVRNWIYKEGSQDKEMAGLPPKFNENLYKVNCSNFGKYFMIDKPVDEMDISYLDLDGVWTTGSFKSLYEREATYATISVINYNVALSVNNTYNYNNWDDILDNRGDADLSLYASRLSYSLLTDGNTNLPILTLYDEAVAGLLTCWYQNKRKVVVLTKERAITLFHLLYQLVDIHIGRLCDVTPDIKQGGTVNYERFRSIMNHISNFNNINTFLTSVICGEVDLSNLRY